MKGNFYNLKERTFEFALKILEVAAMLPKTTEGDIIQRQLIKAGTSIGANVEEADGVSTKADFVSKLTIARKEAKETSYWLRLIARKFIKSDTIETNIKECAELIRIFSSIINKTR